MPGLREILQLGVPPFVNGGNRGDFERLAFFETA
jgi:hypothetical protein